MSYKEAVNWFNELLQQEEMVLVKSKLKEIEALKFMKTGSAKLNSILLRQYFIAIEQINEFQFSQLVFILKEYPRLKGILKATDYKTKAERNEQRQKATLEQAK